MEDLKIRFKEIIEKLGYYLYDLSFVKEKGDNILRVLIENDSSIDVDDCVTVSRALSEELDILDPIDEPYNLEVSSSGAERELRTIDEIKRAVSKNVYIQTMDQTLTGKLLSFDGDIIEITYRNKRIKINYIDVSFIRLAIVF